MCCAGKSLWNCCRTTYAKWNIHYVVTLFKCCTMLIVFPTEDWLPGGFTVLSWEHRCHHADNQSDPKGQLSSLSVNSLNIPGFCFDPSANLFCLMAFSFYNPSSSRISAVQTSTTQALPSLASPVLWPLTSLGTWPMTSWHWWVMERMSRGLPTGLIIFFCLGHKLKSCLHGICCVSLPRCRTLNPTSGRKLCWSCTKCSSSTRSPCALRSPGLRRNWKIQTQVLGNQAYSP